MTKPTDAQTAQDIDQAVGERIRSRRVLRGLTQDQLGEALGISYQQIQKYETGANRVSAGRLYLIAQTLQISPGWFFETPDQDDQSRELSDASSRAILECVRNLSRISDDRVRSVLQTLVRTLAEAEGTTLETDDAPVARPMARESNPSSNGNGLSN